LGKSDGVFEGHARSRADGEVDRAQRVADEDDVAIAPAAVADDAVVHPTRAVAQELVTVQIGSEELLAIAPTVVVGQLPQPGTLERRCVALDNEGAVRRTVSVVVGNKRAVGSLAARP